MPLGLICTHSSFRIWKCEPPIFPAREYDGVCLTKGVTSTMPHQAAGFTKAKAEAEAHSGAAQDDTYRHCETVLNYETALLECASGSQSAVGKIYVREKDKLRAVAHRIVHDGSHAEDVIHDAFAQILRC